MDHNIQFRLTEEQEKHLIGLLIRRERNIRNIKLSCLAKMIGKSKQYVSEIENGIKKIPYSTINDIFKFMNIKFKFEYLDDINRIFSDFIECFYYHDLSNAINKLQIIISNNCEYLNWNEPTRILSKFILNAMRHESSTDFFEIEQIFDFLPKNQQCIFYFFKGYIEYSEKKDDEAILSYKTSLEISGVIPYFNAIIYSAIALSLDRQNNLIDAIHYNNLAYTVFTKDNNVERAITNELHISNEYSKLFMLDKAIFTYKVTLNDARRFNILRIINLVYCNLAITYLYCEKYEEAINTAIEGIKYIKDIEYLYYVLTWCSYELKDFKKSKYYLMKLKRCDKELPLFLKHILEIQKIKLEEGIDNDNYIECLLSFFDYNVVNEMAAEQIFSLKLIINYYDLISDYRNAYRYTKLLLSYYQKIK